MSDSRRTYLLVDGENIDATLGFSILGHRASSDERPRWDRVLNHARKAWDQPVTGLFFLNASQGQLPMPFVQALLAMDYRPVPLSGSSDQKVVDIGIQRTLAAIVPRDADVLLASHDGDFAPQLESLLTPGRRVGLMAFREFVSGQLSSLDIEVHDLEDDVAAFNVPLPRLRIIPVDAFDPERFLL